MKKSKTEMNRRRFVQLAGVGGLALSFSSLLSGAAAKDLAQGKKRPNVVLILADDLGYGDLSCLGNPVNKTPHIDELYSQSARMTNFHVDPCCAPTRAALLTGRYSSRTGVWHTVMGRSILPKEEVIIAETFLKNGYQTGIFGKWHLGDNYPCRARDRGFKESVVFGGGAIGNIQDYWGNQSFDDTYCHNGKMEKYSGYCTDVFFKAAMGYIDSVKDQPFFCYIPTSVPHSPLKVADNYVKPYHGLGSDRREKLYGVLANLDENIGYLMRFLKDKGLEDNTILIFMSDNGTAVGADFEDNGFVRRGYNAGMRGDKCSAYEGGHRVPFFIRWPAGGIKTGRDIPQLTAHLDVVPTLVKLCGLERDEKTALDGTSLDQLLAGREANWQDRTLFVHTQRVDIPVKWKDCAVMTSRWRLIGGKELYDIRKDPEQRENVATEHPDVVRNLRSEYERWWDDVSGCFKDYVWIPVGTGGENPVMLTSHDIHGQVRFDQSHVQRNMRCDGFWTIEVMHDGDYEIQVQRWPNEANIAVRDAPEDCATFKPTLARVRAGDNDMTLPVREGDRAVTFKLRLSKQRTKLQAWLIDDVENGETNGAFFVYVRKV